MLKTTLKILMWMAASIFVVFLGLFIYLTKPYIVTIDEFRTTGLLETVRISYGHACGEEFFSNGENKYILSIPEDGKHPLEIPGLYFGSSFNIVGYSYTIERKNYLTGEVTKIRSQRIDTVEWSAIIPYNIYDPSSDNLYKEAISPIEWKNQDLNPKFAVTTKVEAVGC